MNKNNSSWDDLKNNFDKEESFDNGFKTLINYIKAKKTSVIIKTVSLLLVTSFLITGFVTPAFLFGSKNQNPFYPNNNSNNNTNTNPNDDQNSHLNPNTDDSLADNLELDAEILSKEPEYSPLKAPLSGTKPFKKDTGKGLILSAESNALDKDREFNVSEMTSAQLDQLFAEKTSEIGYVPYAGFTIDAGMKGHEKFPGTVLLEFDLEKLNVPKEVWNQCSIICVSDEGIANELITKLEGTKLICETNHNSAFVVGCTLLAMTGLCATDKITSGTLNYKYNKEVYKCKSGGVYNLYYEYTGSTIEQELAKKQKELFEFYKERNFKDTSVDIDRYGATVFKHIEGEADVKREIALQIAKDKRNLMAGIEGKDQKWRMEHLWPDSMKRIIKALEIVDDYIFNKRGFKRPLFNTDIYINPNPKGPNLETFGHTVNRTTMSPFIYIYNDSKNFKDDTSLYVTLVHEMFHVVQGSRYSDNDFNSDLVFWEATAVTLEREAYRYFTDNYIVGKNYDALTDRNNWGDFRWALMNFDMWQGGDVDVDTLSKGQGYTDSHFLEFIKNRYKIGEDFLIDLMNWYDCSSGSWIYAVKQVTHHTKYGVKEYLSNLASSAFSKEKNDPLLNDLYIFFATNINNFYLYSDYATTGPKLINRLSNEKIKFMEKSILSKNQPISCDFESFLVNPKIKEEDFSVAIELGNEKHDLGDRCFLRVCKDEGKTLLALMMKKGIMSIGNPRSFNIQMLNCSLKEEAYNEYKVYLIPKPKDTVFRLMPNKDGEKDDEIAVSMRDKQNVTNRMDSVVTFYGKDTKHEIVWNKKDKEIIVNKLELMEKLKVKNFEEITCTLRFAITSELGEKPTTAYGPEANVLRTNVEFRDISGTYEGTYHHHDGTTMHGKIIIEYIERWGSQEDGTGHYNITAKFGPYPTDGPNEVLRGKMLNSSPTVPVLIVYKAKDVQFVSVYGGGNYSFDYKNETCLYETFKFNNERSTWMEAKRTTKNK